MHLLWLVAWIVIALGWASPASSAPPNWPASLMIGTASPGGAYYPYGQELAAILTEAIGIPVSAQSTQGAGQNLLLLDGGQIQLGFTSMGPALQAWNGSDPSTHGKKLRSIRALFPMYDTFFEFVALNSSGVRSLRELAGKRVGVGPQGGTGATYAGKIFTTLGASVTLRYGAWTTMSTQMQSGLLDGLIGVAGLPFPALAEIDKRGETHFIELSGSDVAELHKAMPELSLSTVPAGSFPSLKADYRTVGMFNFVVASKSLPDDLIYAITKAFYTNHDRLVRAFPAARESVAANVGRDEFLPFHPGAVRYYREIGVAIPDALSKSTAQ